MLFSIKKTEAGSWIHLDIQHVQQGDVSFSKSNIMVTLNQWGA
jgi:hypothetical protein